jgi:hypothetical protein
MTQSEPDIWDISSDRVPEGAQACPFCGGSSLGFIETHVARGKNSSVESARVECQECFCCGPQSVDNAKDPFKAAVTRWNQRKTVNK